MYLDNPEMSSTQNSITSSIRLINQELREIEDIENEVKTFFNRDTISHENMVVQENQKATSENHEIRKLIESEQALQQEISELDDLQRELKDFVGQQSVNLPQSLPQEASVPGSRPITQANTTTQRAKKTSEATPDVNSN